MKGLNGLQIYPKAIRLFALDFYLELIIYLFNSNCSNYLERNSNDKGLPNVIAIARGYSAEITGHF